MRLDLVQNMISWEVDGEEIDKGTTYIHLDIIYFINLLSRFFNLYYYSNIVN